MSTPPRIPPASPTVVIVPGLRDHDAEHWQTLLADRLDDAHIVAPVADAGLRLAPRIQALDEALHTVDGPVVLVAHSAGCVITAHWSLAPTRPVLGALLATPADLESPLPAGYPDIDDLHAAGWTPLPRHRLPFPSVVAASRNDPLAAFSRTADLAADWGARLVDVGEVGHLNPAAGFGPWPQAEELLHQLIGHVDPAVTAPPSHLPH